MKLADLHPELAEAVEGRPAILWFDCPKCGDGERPGRCGGAGIRVYPGEVPANAVHPCWSINGEQWDTITLLPSVHNLTCGAHFFVTNGEIVMCP